MAFAARDPKTLQSFPLLFLKGPRCGAFVKNLPTNAGDGRDMHLIPGSGTAPGRGNGNNSSILAWKIPWTEEAGRPHSSGGHRDSDTTDQLSTQRHRGYK